MGGDPVKDGLVESFNRPGGNVTGMTLMTNLMEPKRFGLLRDLVPDARLVGVLFNPNFAPSARQLEQIEEAARSIGQRLVVAKASTDAELDAGFAALVQERADALLVAADPYFDTRRDKIVDFARRQRLPAIYQFREYVLAGELLSYGVSITDAYRQFGVYTATILKGAKPADLPVPTQTSPLHLVATASPTGNEPPRPLEEHGRALWDRILSEYDIADAGGREMLLQAAEALDRLQELRAQITVARKNGFRNTPLLKVELATRNFIVRTLQRLGLNLEPLNQRPGRPPTPTTWIPHAN
jgi:ABC transporter substrate binding protein